MNFSEILSTMYGFKRLKTEDLYDKLFDRVLKEAREEDNLDVLAISPYMVASTSINPLHLSVYRPRYKTNYNNLELLKTVQPML